MKKLSVLLTLLLAVLTVHVSYAAPNGWSLGSDLYVRGDGATGSSDKVEKMTYLGDGEYVYGPANSNGWFKFQAGSGTGWDDNILVSANGGKYTLPTTHYNDSSNRVTCWGGGDDFNAIEGKYIYIKFDNVNSAKVLAGDAPSGGGGGTGNLYITGKAVGDDGEWGTNWHAMTKIDGKFRTASTVQEGGFLLSTKQGWDGKLGASGGSEYTLTATPTAKIQSQGSNFNMPNVADKYIWVNLDTNEIWYGDATLGGGDTPGETITFYLDINNSSMADSRSWANCYVRNMSNGTMTAMTAVSGETKKYKVTVAKSNDDYAFSRTSAFHDNGDDSKYDRSSNFKPEDGKVYTLEIEGGNLHYTPKEAGTVTTEFTVGDDLWVYGTAYGSATTAVQMTYLGDNHYKADANIVGQGTFRITRVRGNNGVAYVISAKGTETYTVPTAANAATSKGKVVLFGTSGAAFVANAVSVGGTVHFIYDDNADLCQIYYTKEDVSYNIGYSVISSEWGWAKPAEKGKMTIDTSVEAPEGTTVYSVHVDHMPAGTDKEWSFFSYDLDNRDLATRKKEYKVSDVEYTNNKFTPAEDTKYTLTESEGGKNLLSSNVTRPATIYLSVDANGNKQFWFKYDPEPWVPGTESEYSIQGLILGGWAKTDYAYFGTVGGVKYYGAKDGSNVFGPSNYALRTNLDQTSGDQRWRPFLANANSTYYMTITIPATGVNVANANWAYGYGTKAWGAIHNGKTLTTGVAYGITDDGNNDNKFDASKFQAGKTYLFTLEFTGGNNTNLTVVEYTDDHKKLFPKFEGTPTEGRWEDKNEKGEALEVKFVASEYEGIYVYDFSPEKFYEIQFTNTEGEPEMYHFNVSHRSGNTFWEETIGNKKIRYDHSPIGEDNALDLDNGTPLPFKEGGGVGQNFLLKGPAKVYFRHLETAEDGANGYMWVEPYQGQESDYEAVFTFWDKGGTEWPNATDYSKWWDNKATGLRKVEIFAKNVEGAPVHTILGGENSQATRIDASGKKVGTNRGFNVKVREDLLAAVGYYQTNADGSVMTDANGKPVIDKHELNQPVGLWVRIYKDLNDAVNYLERPYAYNATYTQNPDDNDPLYNNYPDEFLPGNPHVEFVASAEPIRVDGVEADNQLNPGGMDTKKLSYPFVNEFSLEAVINTRKSQDDDDKTDSYPFIPTAKGDDRYKLDDTHTCSNGVKHKIYTVKDKDENGKAISIWTKQNTVSVRYMGNNRPEITKVGNVGMGVLKGFSPRYANDKDALTVAVRYSSPGMIFTRTQSEKIFEASKHLLARTETLDFEDDYDDVHEALFYGDNHDKDGKYINKDVLDMIIYNENVIAHHDDRKISEYFKIPESDKIFAAYIGYTVEVDRPEDGDPETIHEFTPYYWNAYNQGVPVTDFLAPMIELIQNSKAEKQPNENWSKMPVHDPETWHMLTNPFGEADEDEDGDPYVYDHNSLAIHIHHLYCQDNNNADLNDKVEFESVEIPVQITYEIYLPVLHNLRYVRPIDDDPFANVEEPSNVRRHGKARAGEATQADDPEIVVGNPGNDNALAKFTYKVTVNAAEVDPNATITSISNVEVDNSNAPVEYYTIQGIRVKADNLTPGIYIRRQGNKAVKVAIR